MRTDLERYRAGLDDDKWERHLETRLNQVGIRFVRQFAWAKDLQANGRPFPKTPTGKARGWVADFAIVDESGIVHLLIEVDGKIWQKGGHTSGTGYSEDRVRDNEALCHGLRTVRVTVDQVESDQALDWIERLVRGDK